MSARPACEVLTLPVAAEVLGISAETARKLAVRGELPGAIRIGRQWRVSRPALEQFLSAPALPSSAGVDGAGLVHAGEGSGGAGPPSNAKAKSKSAPPPPKRRLRKAG
jgi:excisionase family DNA binding protein